MRSITQVAVLRVGDERIGLRAAQLVPVFGGRGTGLERFPLPAPGHELDGDVPRPSGESFW